MRLREAKPIFCMALKLKLTFSDRRLQSAQPSVSSRGSSKHLGIGIYAGVAVSFVGFIFHQMQIINYSF